MTNGTNENENCCSKKRKMLAPNVIFISFTKNATTSCTECDTCCGQHPCTGNDADDIVIDYVVDSCRQTGLR